MRVTLTAILLALSASMASAQSDDTTYFYGAKGQYQGQAIQSDGSTYYYGSERTISGAVYPLVTARAAELAPVVRDLQAREIACAACRKIATPRGARWSTQTVKVMVERLAN
jgi:hypothetical protein